MINSEITAKEDIVNILYSGDANIRDGVIISALSLARVVKEPLNIYILTASLEQCGEFKAALEPEFAPFLEKYLKRYNDNLSVKVIDISDSFNKELPVANVDTRFTPFCMLRLFADRVDELPSKILYLDNDVICRSDPSDFYHQSMEGISLAGVLDYYGSWFFRQKFYKRDYLNSGVLLLNLEEITRNGLFAEAKRLCITKKMFMPDQSALNKLCKNKKICDRRYNEQRRLARDTVFQHFTTGFRFFPYFHTVSVKPWNIDAVHKVLKLNEYDLILNEYLEIKNTYKRILKQ